ncbi:hypothetical protein [Gayadomonas joobiniege]|uniref:hypothetical protein n=1 Tax=Gayadomonas joobiniege TaxID=1234606 RepID=UPI00037FF5FC|nr:hypothetical protein [Gayadomonas joobiniege]
MTRRGWNNVLIFSTLIMIFLFNGLHHKLFSSEADVEVILPPNQHLYSIDFPGVSVQKMSDGQWQMMTAQDIYWSSKRIEQLVHQWQQLKAEILTDPPTFKGYPEATVSFWFSNQQKAFVARLYQQQGHLYLTNGKNVYMLPESQNLEALLPLLQ